jgi:hypothetical protein
LGYINWLLHHHGPYSAHTTTAYSVSYLDHWLHHVRLGIVDQAKFWYVGQLLPAGKYRHYWTCQDAMSLLNKDPWIDQLIEDIDQLLKTYEPQLNAIDLAGVLLSRVTLLCTMYPQVGKGLVRFVWEKLDEIEQANPGGMIDD